MIHSLWAYVVLAVLIIAVINAFIGLSKKKNFEAKDLRISLFAVIATHIQLIIGFIAYYLSSFYSIMRDVGMGEVMKNGELRKLLVEHPLTIIIAIILITIGFSKHKKKTTSASKFKTIAVYYTIGLVLILAVIPWNLWFSN
ncbi:MAG TPA: hypothetical protein VJ970_01395 [Flavobacteriaceae bacterium]|nr:hypothetical protein [Flavobacteriaceae bacterium]